MPPEPPQNPPPGSQLPESQPLSEAEVRTLGRLARLALDDAAVARLKAELGGVLDRAACLLEADLEGVEPMARPIEEPNRLREDEPGATLPIEAVAALAPGFEDGLFRVPKVL
ncbi:MAG: Asp-tRNA(Asn)/Glu-tRNA(Gln) amidotransferase subunit GatC, partial [Planctomycetota bacterium]